jgi:Uma2 family endonuclease
LPVRLHCYTYLEYRSLEDASVTKHEFLDGEIYAMAGGTPLHAALGAAVVTSLGNQLGGSPCRVYNSDLRVRVVATGLATYPDATVVRGDVESDLEDRQAVVNPKAIVEVLSDGTEAYDRGEKLAHYQKIASLDAVVLVSQKERRIELWQRENVGWVRAEAGRGQSVAVNSIGCTLTVDAVYDAAGAEESPVAPLKGSA